MKKVNLNRIDLDWKKTDEELFADKGRVMDKYEELLAREYPQDDLAGIEVKSIDKASENLKKNLHRNLQESDVNSEIIYEFNNRISDKFDECSKNCEKFKIGNLPTTEKRPIGEITNLNTNSRRKVNYDYFKYNKAIFGLSRAKNSVRNVTYYSASPLLEIKHLLLHIFMAIFSVFQVVYAMNDNYFENIPAYIPKIPVILPKDADFNTCFLVALMWLIVGAAVCVFCYYAEDFFNYEIKGICMYLFFGYCVLTVGFAITSLRLLFISAVISFLMMLLCLVLFVMNVGSLFIILGRLFKRFNRKAQFPEDYDPKFPEYAAEAQFNARLRIIWYEKTRNKKAPAMYYNALKKLEKLDKKFRKGYAKYCRIFKIK